MQTVGNHSKDAVAGERNSQHHRQHHGGADWDIGRGPAGSITV